jgi:hypothetical protein
MPRVKVRVSKGSSAKIFLSQIFSTVSFLPIVTLSGPVKGTRMKIKQVRAVIRRGDLPPAKTDWFPFDSTDVAAAVARLMPTDDPDAGVVWEEREVEVNNSQGPAPPDSE